MNSSQLQLEVNQVDTSSMTNSPVSETWGLHSQTYFNEQGSMVFPGAAADLAIYLQHRPSAHGYTS